MSHARYIGIDPGINGGIGVLDRRGRLLSLHEIPVIGTGSKKEIHLGAVKSILCEAMQVDYRSAPKDQKMFAKVIPSGRLDVRPEECLVAIEKCHAMPKQGVRSTWRFGHACGSLLGVATGLGMTIMMVPPRQWQKRCWTGVAGSDTHSRSILAASQMFPEMPPLTRKKDHNVACALLIAEFGRRGSAGTKAPTTSESSS